MVIDEKSLRMVSGRPKHKVHTAAHTAVIDAKRDDELFAVELAIEEEADEAATATPAPAPGLRSQSPAGLASGGSAQAVDPAVATSESLAGGGLGDRNPSQSDKAGGGQGIRAGCEAAAVSEFDEGGELAQLAPLLPRDPHYAHVIAELALSAPDITVAQSDFLARGVELDYTAPMPKDSWVN